MPNGTNLAIGLVTYNSKDDLSTSLGATAEIARELDAELLVFDNDSADGTVEFIQSTTEATVIPGGHNGGYARGVNGLFAAAGSRDLLLLNPDVQVESADQIRALLAELRPGVGLVAPKLRNLDGTVQESVRRFPTFVGMAGRSSAVAQRSAKAREAAERYTELPRGDEPVPVDWAIGAAMLISNDAYRIVGGWDEGYFLYLEDVDFCLRLAQAGLSRIYKPTAELKHVHHRSSDACAGSVLRSAARRHHVKSTLRFFAKYRSLQPGAHHRARRSRRSTLITS